MRLLFCASSKASTEVFCFMNTRAACIRNVSTDEPRYGGSRVRTTLPPWIAAAVFVLWLQASQGLRRRAPDPVSP